MKKKKSELCNLVAKSIYKGSKKLDLTVHQARFNYTLALWLKDSVKDSDTNYFKIALEANKIFASCYGYYPETDYQWQEQLIYELLLIIVDYCEQLAYIIPDEETEEHLETLYDLTMCELTAKKLS